jgi:hypothetical protein
MLSDANIPSEIRKLMGVADLQRELQNLEYPIHNEEDAQNYRSINELAGGYYKAKWDHHVDKTLSQLKITTQEHDREWAENFDRDMKERVEIMYSYDDISNDRHILRNQFVREMNKKTTLRDIGSKLDEFILDSKANQAEFYRID